MKKLASHLSFSSKRNSTQQRKYFFEKNPHLKDTFLAFFFRGALRATLLHVQHSLLYRAAVIGASAVIVHAIQVRQSSSPSPLKSQRTCNYPSSHD